MTQNERKWYHDKYHYDRDENGEPVYKTNYKRIASAAILIPGIVLAFMGLYLMIGWTTSVGVPVHREYSNYIDSAEDMYDPHLVIQALEQAIQGIEDLGLEPTDNAALFRWNRN